MNIDSTIVSSVLGFVNIGVGFMLKHIFDLLKSKVDQGEHDGTIQRLEREINDRVHVDHCSLKVEMNNKSLAYISEQVRLVAERNKTDYNEIKEWVREVRKDAKATADALYKINKCLALLAERIDSSMEKKK